MVPIRNIKAFTLIELVICMVIAGLLASVGAVAYTHYTDSARTTEAIGVIKAITQAQRLYRELEGEYFSAGDIYDPKLRDLGLSDVRYFTYSVEGKKQKFTVRAETNNGGWVTFEYPKGWWKSDGQIIQEDDLPI